MEIFSLYVALNSLAFMGWTTWKMKYRKAQWKQDKREVKAILSDTPVHENVIFALAAVIAGLAFIPAKFVQWALGE